MDNRDIGMVVKCTFCDAGEVVYARKYSGEALCRRCFLENMVERVRATISKYELLNPFDRIAVAVSGGKDSLSLLKILVKIEKDFPRASLVAITVDEGIPLYRDESIENAVIFVSELGVEHKVVSFKELYGFTLTEVVESNVSRSLNLQPCTICGILRRRALTIVARECGASVIATAHTLDDIVQTYLMNILRGDTRLTSIGVRREAPGVIPRIAPFRLTPEREVVLYAYLSKIPFQTYTCPYTELSMRDRIRSFLIEYEELFPGTLYTALSSFEKMFTRDLHEDGAFCTRCGEPTSRKICRACEIVELISSKMKQ